MKRRAFLGVIGIGLGADYLDNKSVDGSAFRFISDRLDGDESDELPSNESSGFNGKYAGNSNSPGGNEDEFDADEGTTTTEDSPYFDGTTTESTPETTSTTEPTTTTQTTSEPSPTTTTSRQNDLGPACDRLYLQKAEDSNKGDGDGTVVALDLADQEYRIFAPEHFPDNSELTGLYDEIVDERGRESLPAGLGKGVRSTRDELFDYSKDIYDDMADEEEWDTIFDENSESNCTL